MRTFETPEQAVESLIAAIRKGDDKAILAILGPQAKTLVSSGDPIADRALGERFVGAYDASHTLKAGGGKIVLMTGGDQFPFAIPVVPDGPRWRFPSPLGRLVALARAEGYGPRAKGRPAPYHGYYYRVLEGQGPQAPGGAYAYVANGRMIGGFALIAFPAQYGVSGVTTFMVNHDGMVYEKDLGPRTAALARQVTVFDPDPTWQKVATE